MWDAVLAATSSAGTAATGGAAVATFVGWNVVRALWRMTRVTLPDGRRVTRGERDAWMRAERRRNIAMRKEWERQQRAARR